MTPADCTADSTTVFARHRPRLLRIAYRMLGSMAEAEDVVQDAYLRWHQAEDEVIREPEAFLVRMVSRLCLDVLKSARVQRETYPGPWLPEPVIDADEHERDHITLTLMMALERLSPLERAAFLLHDVFGLDFDEVGRAIGREGAACRQLASRARSHVQAARPRYPLAPEQAQGLASAFFTASRSGDLNALQGLLAADVVTYTDGGGKRPAAINPIFGQEKVGRFFLGLTRKADYQRGQLIQLCSIDGLPGFISLERQDTWQSTALEIEEGRIAAIYIVRNPDKLRHIARSHTHSAVG